MAICLTCGQSDCTNPCHLSLCPRCKIRTKQHKSQYCKPCSKRTFASFEDAKIITLYKQGWLIRDIAKKYSVTRWVISGILDRADIQRHSLSKSKQIYTANEHFFDAIDNELKSYWYGFLAADGWVCTVAHKYSTNLELKASDRAHLEKFKTDIDSTHPILTRTQTVKGQKYQSMRISIGNKHLAKSLIELGIVPGKDATLQLPDLPIVLMRHFIRGYFDGDGSISKSPALQFSLVGNRTFLLAIQTILMERCNLTRTKLVRQHNSQSFSLCYGGNRQVPRILKYLYENATVYLNRKFQYYLNWPASHSNNGSIYRLKI